MSSILYDIFEFQIQVTNKFQTDGEFLILVQHEKKTLDAKKRKKGAPKEAPVFEEEFPSFFC